MPCSAMLCSCCFRSVHPGHVSGAKDDPLDAQLALELLLTHPEKLTGLQPQGAAMRTLL